MPSSCLPCRNARQNRHKLNITVIWWKPDKEYMDASCYGTLAMGLLFTNAYNNSIATF
jgi:hypothetical protein